MKYFNEYCSDCNWLGLEDCQCQAYNDDEHREVEKIAVERSRCLACYFQNCKCAEGLKKK